MKINLQNIEELIFYNKKVNSLFPEFRHYFDQWQLGQRIPGMKTLAQRSVLELLNSLNETHVSKLEEYYQDIILVDKINHNLNENYEWNLDEENNLCKFVGFKDFCLTRNEKNVKISFWR